VRNAISESYEKKAAMTLNRRILMKKRFKVVKELSKNDQELLWWRSRLEKADDAAICLHLEFDC